MSMKKVDRLTEEIKKKILDLLYCDEMYNTILIELIENGGVNLNDLYIHENEEDIEDILHIKNDGNSDFTTFYCTSEEGVQSIASQINKLPYKNILLGGKFENVEKLLRVLGYEKALTPNVIYQLDRKKYRSLDIEFESRIRLAKVEDKDIGYVRKFTIDFFKAETEEEIMRIGNIEKILDKVERGVYLLEYEGEIIGMARFISKTKKFLEITSVYIDKAYRNRGFGKELIGHMIDIGLQKGKSPILVTSITNRAAKQTYESMGFVKAGDYAYEFL